MAIPSTRPLSSMPTSWFRPVGDTKWMTPGGSWRTTWRTIHEYWRYALMVLVEGFVFFQIFSHLVWTFLILFQKLIDEVPLGDKVPRKKWKRLICLFAFNNQVFLVLSVGILTQITIKCLCVIVTVTPNSRKLCLYPHDWATVIYESTFGVNAQRHIILNQRCVCARACNISRHL